MRQNSYAMRQNPICATFCIHRRNFHEGFKQCNSIVKRQSRNIKLCALSAPQNWKLCMFSSIFMLNVIVLKCLIVLVIPILALHIINFSSCRNYWGQNDVCPLNIFRGRTAPPPPHTLGSMPLKWCIKCEIARGRFRGDVPYANLRFPNRSALYFAEATWVENNFSLWLYFSLWCQLWRNKPHCTLCTLYFRAKEKPRK